LRLPGFKHPTTTYQRRPAIIFRWRRCVLLDRVIARLYWRNREADEHFEGAVENLKDMITGQATVLALGAITGGYDDAPITCAALRAYDIGFPHQPNMRRGPVFFQSGHNQTDPLPAFAFIRSVGSQFRPRGRSLANYRPAVTLPQRREDNHMSSIEVRSELTGAHKTLPTFAWASCL
jgi:hypothetical protein